MSEETETNLDDVDADIEAAVDAAVDAVNADGVAAGEEESPDEAPKLPAKLPLLPLRGTVVLPLQMAPLVVGQDRSIRLVDDVMQGDRLVVMTRQKEDDPPATSLDELHTVGAVAAIHQMKRLPNGELRILVQGIERIRLRDLTETEPYLVATFDAAPANDDESVVTAALGRTVRSLFTELVDLVPELPDVVAAAVEGLTDLEHIAYVVASTMPLDSDSRQELLETDEVPAQLRRLVEWLQREISVRKLGQKIATDAEKEMTKAQREYFLRQQLKAIRKELGEEDDAESAQQDLKERLEALELNDDARREVDRELRRLERIPEASPEHGVVRTFLEWIADLPWSRGEPSPIDVARAREVLDDDHHGLERVKDRILEYLSVRKLRRARGLDEAEEGFAEPILCFAGPPGVGKTSLGQSIARALGRKFVRISLGGVDDESEIRGHRRTYVGAMPGRIIAALRRSETSDSVFMLDEVDKLGRGVRGDPAAALLEVLDPAQNSTFVDTYLGVPYDLSRVLFICTANTTSTIPRPLLDRMETLDLPGYTEDEKVAIAKKYLLPRQRGAHGLEEGELELGEDGLRGLVRHYTREAGVRNLDRTIARVCRKAARRLAEGESGPLTVDPEKLADWLGPVRNRHETAERTDRPGVATGLAWTPVGGELLFVEAAVVPRGQNRITLTGSLGDVMRESAQAALTYVRSHAEELGVEEDAFDGKDVHIHVPSGAIPKDGPSAGVTIVTALASAASDRKVRSDVAMTGEISLRGKVLPVGGIKEKMLAAHRAGIRRVIIPEHNGLDLEEIPEELRSEMTFILADTIDQVLAESLAKP